MPKSETAVMVFTVVVTVRTHNLAIGVGRRRAGGHGVLRPPGGALRDGGADVVELNGEKPATYAVDGELFFASSNDLVHPVRLRTDPAEVIIDLHASHLWDASTVAALDAITEKYRQHGKHVEIIGLNSASVAMRERMAGKLPMADPVQCPADSAW